MWSTTLTHIFCWLMVMVFVAGCNRSDPILVGFAAELTGKRGELGVAARNGAQMAVNEINERGGVNHRPLKLLIQDDQGQPETARQVDAELVAAGVVAIIGHTTSQQTTAVFDQLNQAKVVLLSPTSTSTDFSRQADYFFRVIPGNDFLGMALARHIYRNRSIKRIVGIYDLSNRSFAETQWQAVRAEFERLGGEAGPVFTFTSGETNLKQLMAQVAAVQPEGVVIVASAIDAALLAQYGRQQNLRSHLFSSSWAYTGELLEKGGQAVEGMDLGSFYNAQNPYPAFTPYLNRFTSLYQHNPDFPAAYAYESVLVLARALEQTGGSADGLPQALTQINNLAGIQGAISIDAFGDVNRDIYIVTVENGKFAVKATVPALR
ncbi:MAG: Leucine-, isoleucine-, valine-, threonine-, and alanine-binding protein [Anaerolineae bacterium]|nr:Leucine-, isoleucine-, valine-, threonine-, and alanine-binding protein [Anaerolineae bacterium]